MTAVTLKLDTLYAAFSPELGMVSYGQCQDEALNNLTDEIHQHQKAGERSVQLETKNNTYV